MARASISIRIGILIFFFSLNSTLLAQDRNLYWGETHLHTNASVDAYVVGDYFTGPDEAYMFAKGAPVLHTRLQTRVQIDRPLDFMVVADHATRMRLQVNILEGAPALKDVEGYAEALEFVKNNPRGTMAPPENFPISDAMKKALVSDEVRLYSWHKQIEAAERHNNPGKFTTFAGWEWTRNRLGNQHRVVFTPSGPDITKQFVPFSVEDGENPEDLWKFLEQTSKTTGADFVAMPHNSNLSDGYMFSLVDSEGRPIDANYAKTRARWEPVMEITQMKGTSETRSELSPNDEFANFEIHTDLLIGGQATPKAGDYARTALLRGLQIQKQVGENPFKLGFIGSSDSHTGLATVEENNFLGKTVRDTLPQERLDSPLTALFHSWEMSASGIAAVWAEENTRDSIAAAFKRREVYGTSGPRMSLRVFAGFRFNKNQAQGENLVEVGYARGVPMGGDLTAAKKKDIPGFLIHAAKDPIGANLDRVQVIKGWIGDNGEQQEKVFDVLWSDHRKLDSNGKLPAVGNTVDVKNALYENSIGAAQLTGFWQDPEFNSEQHAFYYVRVLEIPTPRHSTYDAVALGVDVAKTQFPATIQERAWSSPIWYTP